MAIPAGPECSDNAREEKCSHPSRIHCLEISNRNQSIQKKYVTIRDILSCYEHLLWYANFCLTINKCCFSSSNHDIVLQMSFKKIQKINAGHLLGKKMYKTLFDKSYSKKGFSFDVQVYRALCMSTPGRYSSVGLNIAPAPTLVVPSTTSSATIVTEQEGTNRWMLMAVDKPTTPAPITTTFAVMTENTLQYCTAGNELPEENFAIFTQFLNTINFR